MNRVYETKRVCPSCHGNLCEFCGGCINQGECSCFTEAKTSTVLKQAARIAELEAALKQASIDLHYTSEHRGNWPECEHSNCVTARAILKVQS